LEWLYRVIFYNGWFWLKTGIFGQNPHLRYSVDGEIKKPTAVIAIGWLWLRGITTSSALERCAWLVTDRKHDPATFFWTPWVGDDVDV